MSEKNNDGPKGTPAKTPKETPEQSSGKVSNNANTGSFASLLFSKVGATKEKNKQVFMMRVPEAVIETQDLKHLKSLMTSQKDAKERAFLPFCNQAGAVVDNSWKIQDYVDTVKSADKDKKPKTYEFYLLEKTVLDSKILPKIELKLPEDVKYLDPAVLKKLESSIDLASWRAAKGSGQNSGPAQLKENDWQIVATSNSLCYGLSIMRMIKGSGEKAEGIPIGVARARQPAFQIKARQLKISDQPEPELRIPDFIVDDQSYVSIYETRSQFQSSLSQSSISTWDILRSGAMSFLGNSIGTSAGYAQSNSERSYEIKKGDTARMNISYNFPRATLILDQYSLELTKQCEDDLKLVKDKISLENFLELYGEYFSREVQVGGRLFASEDFEWTGEGSGSDVKKSMKIQAASSLKGEIKGVGVEGGVQGGYGQSSGTERNATQGAMENSLQWQANGGDTLLCNNPPEWCPTVAPHHNWRIINRAGNCHLLDLIAKFPKQGRIQKFIEKEEYKEVIRSLQPKSGRKFYLRNEDEFQYLTAYSPSKVPAEIKKTKPAGSSRAYGTAMFSPTAPESENSGLYFEFETLQGEPVHKIEYAKPYVLKNSATGRFVSFARESGAWLVASNKPTDEFVFLEGSTSTEGEVNQQDLVYLGISPMTGEEPRFVSKTISWHGNNGILRVSEGYMVRSMTKQKVRQNRKSFKLLYQDREKA